MEGGRQKNNTSIDPSIHPPTTLGPRRSSSLSKCLLRMQLLWLPLQISKLNLKGVADKNSNFPTNLTPFNYYSSPVSLSGMRTWVATILKGQKSSEKSLLPQFVPKSVPPDTPFSGFSCQKREWVKIASFPSQTIAGIASVSVLHLEFFLSPIQLPLKTGPTSFYVSCCMRNSCV